MKHQSIILGWLCDFLCWLDWHGDSEPTDSFHDVPTFKCLQCGRDYEL